MRDQDRTDYPDDDDPEITHPAQAVRDTERLIALIEGWVTGMTLTESAKQQLLAFVIDLHAGKTPTE